MKKLRIGILIREFKTLQNWELRIIENIKNDSNLTLTLLIRDGRVEDEYIKSNYNSLGEVILKKQISIEKKRYLSNLKTVNNKEIFEYLKSIPTIEVKPKRDGDSDIFNVEDSKKVKEFNLDVILKHGFKFISGKILNSAKYGIWLLVHSDISLKKGGFPGFWEALLKKSVVGVSLLQLSSNFSKGKTIDKAYYNPNYRSFVITNNIVKESSVSLLLKNLRILEKNGKIVIKGTVDLGSLSKTPDLYYAGRYLFNFYNNYISGRIRSLTSEKKVRDQNWTLFIGKGSFMDAYLSQLIPVKTPKDEFWADPFLFKYLHEYYVFFESYSYKIKRGKICCGRVKNDQLVDVVDVLNLDYHLSYPYIFMEDGNIFMIPETGGNRRLEIYKCKKFPDQWDLYSTAFNGDVIQDTTLFIDKKKQKWLFLNKVIGPNVDRTSELYIYKVDSLKLNKIEPHKQNPVIIDSRVARNGGAIFKYHDKIYRPSQSNTDGVYGKALNINEIIKLTVDEYKEETIRKVEPNFQKGLVSIHHLHQIDGMFVFDAAYN